MFKRIFVSISILLAAAAFNLPAANASDELYEVYIDKGLVGIDSGDYLSAIENFSQAGKLNPDSIEAAFYLGQSYWRNGELDEAAGYFRKVCEKAPDSDYCMAARKYLDYYSAKASRNYYASVFTGMQYDTNVAQKSEARSRYLNHVPNKVDWSWLLYLRAGCGLPVAGGFSLGAEYGFYVSSHLKLHDYDVQNHDLNVYAAYNSGPVTAFVSYILKDTYFGGNHFETVNGVMPKLRLCTSPNTMVEACYTYRHDDFVQRDLHDIWWSPGLKEKPRDADNDMYSLDGYYYFMDKRGWARLGYYYESNGARAAEWTYIGNGAVAGLSVPLPMNARAIFDGELQARRYGKRYSALTWDYRRRRNTNLRGTLTLTEQFTDHIGMLASYSYVKDRSSFEELDYDRQLFTILLSAKL